MLGLKTLVALALCAISAANAAPDALLDKRQGTSSLASVSCGSNRYTRQAVDTATAEGCRLNAARQTVGSNNYPHQFRNLEGLAFEASGPFQEFPILSTGQNFTGQSPGPDRIVFNPNLQGKCTYVGSITHTDAPSRNGFVLCNTSKSQSQGKSGTSDASSLAVLPKRAAVALLAMFVGAHL